MIPMPKGMGVFAWKRVILTIATLLFLNGVMSWFTTPQEEDPQLAPRDGIITIIFPGATPKDIQSLVTKPVEDELAKVDSIKSIQTRMRSDLMFMQVKLNDNISSKVEIKDAWDKVQEALDKAEKKLPETAFKPELNKDVYDQDAILIALYGNADPLTLVDEARELRDRLQAIPLVKNIDEVSSPGEQLSIIFDPAKLSYYGVSSENLIKQLRGGNALVPSGYIKMEEKRVSVLTNSFYRSADELSHFPVVLKSGDSISLSEVARVERTPRLPISESMLFNGKPSVGIGVVAKKNINLQKLGSEVRSVIEEFKTRPSFQEANLSIEEISYQPEYVEERIEEIGKDLLRAIFLVGGVLMLMLGLRVGSIVAIQVPIVTIISFGIFSFYDGVLNQISIAAFILAIGLLVDNVVVIVDGIQDKLDQGLDPIKAAEETRKEYLIPLAAGTLTTVAAFIPILASKGIAADFTRDIGVVATIALFTSYFFCILVTPIIAARLLQKGKARVWHFVHPLGEKLGNLVHNHPKTIILVALAAVLISFGSFQFVKKKFFPFADRDLVIIDMQLTEGTHYQTTLENAKKIEALIKDDKRVKSISTFIGRGVPPFYYNLPREPQAPHIAQMIVKLHSNREAKEFKEDQEERIQKEIPFGITLIKEIAQGPVIRAPIEVKIHSHDPEKLELATNEVLKLVREAYGVSHVRSTIGSGMMAINMNVNDSAAGIYGITRAEVSALVLANTRGIPVTIFHGAKDPYSISLISKSNEFSTLSDLNQSYIGSTRTENLNVETLTQSHISYTPSVIEHFNRVPTVYVYGEIAKGSTENIATNSVKEVLTKLKEIDGVEIKLGGSSAESKEANKAIFLAMPIGLFILLISLMFEFNSFRRVAIILTTIPLCAVGAVPGLILTDSIFGFTTLLGFFTLAGTVIHNGIFLLDYIDHKIHDGHDFNLAITEGIQRRTRPIILTAVATIVELIPLTMSSSTLWPPFAWAIITGLAVSTLMTLLVIPAIYKLTFRREHNA